MPIPFYSKRKYANAESGKYKPESMSLHDVVVLGNALRISKEQGVLPEKGLDTLFLANSMVEGRPSNFGVNTFKSDFNKQQIKRMQAMGIDKNLAAVFNPKMPSFPTRLNTLYPSPSLEGFINQGSQDNANTAAFILGEKLQKTGGDIPRAIAAWNGKGKVYEAPWGALVANPSAPITGPQGKKYSVREQQQWPVAADAENHLRKVLEADDLLRTDQRNKQLLDIFRQSVSGLIEYP